jgi:hypothetical protein
VVTSGGLKAAQATAAGIEFSGDGPGGYEIVGE